MSDQYIIEINMSAGKKTIYFLRNLDKISKKCNKKFTFQSSAINPKIRAHISFHHKKNTTKNVLLKYGP